MKNPLAVAGILWRTFGASGIRRRASFEARKRFSRLEASAAPVPRTVLESAPPEHWPFRPNAKRLSRATPNGAAVTRADRVLAGEHEAYRATWRPRPVTPDEWNVNPNSGLRYDAAAAWFTIPHTTPGSDIKDAWEPGRFAWAYDLVRGWVLTRNDRYAHAFWTAFESFRAGCLPYRGVQWACGQETAIRAIALLWAEAALADAPSTSPTRKAALRELLYWSGYRIANALDYGTSQRNNHGISECVGLIALGARFRGWDGDADAWLRDGARELEHQVLDQFAVDGWYAQHSFTYLRLALDQLVQAERVLRTTGAGLSAVATERARAAIGLLATVMDHETGDVPNHGANDGSFVLPLTTRGVRDFRPSLTAAAATFRAALPQSVELDHETLAWLDVEPPTTYGHQRSRIVMGASGWIDARLDDTRVFARAGTYRSRPSHVDALHMDVWIAGAPVAVDAGTYRYIGPWAHALAQERAHNTVAIEDLAMAERGPRFLWLRWPRAVILSFHEDGDAITIDMLNESWRHAGIEHRRTCRMSPDAVTVLDDISVRSAPPARVGIHWLLDAMRDGVRMAADVPVNEECLRGDDASPFGWVAESYGVRRPATSLRLTTSHPVTRVRFVSGFGDARAEEHLQSVLAHGLSRAVAVASLTGEPSR